MENTELLTDSLVEETVQAEDTAPVETDLELGTQAPQEMSYMDMLVNRRTGMFPVKLELADLKWIKNACNANKFTFTGPNEAFMLMNCYMGFSSAIARLEQEETDPNTEKGGPVEIQAAAIEAAAILLNKYESSGIDSAQRVFRIAVALNSPVMEMKQLDQVISQIKVDQAKQDELAAIEAGQAENN